MPGFFEPWAQNWYIVVSTSFSWQTKSHLGTQIQEAGKYSLCSGDLLQSRLPKGMGTGSSKQFGAVNATQQPQELSSYWLVGCCRD